LSEILRKLKISRRRQTPDAFYAPALAGKWGLRAKSLIAPIGDYIGFPVEIEWKITQEQGNRIKITLRLNPVAHHKFKE